MICLLPKGQACYAAVWYKASMADLYKIKKREKEERTPQIVMSLCTHEHSYLHVLNLKRVLMISLVKYLLLMY